MYRCRETLYEYRPEYTTICKENAASETGGPSHTKVLGTAILITGDSSAQQETYYYTDSSCSSVSVYLIIHNDNITIGSFSGANYQMDLM